MWTSNTQRLDEAAALGHSVPCRRRLRLRLLALFARARDTKDIDVFVKPEDCPRVLEVFDRLGYETVTPFPHWLGKIRRSDHFMDVIFGSGNGVARVDASVVRSRAEGEPPRRHCPAFTRRGDDLVEGVHSRARRTTAPMSLICCAPPGPSLDWPRLLMRFGDHWRVLLSHLILFGFIYPDKRQTTR